MSPPPVITVRDDWGNLVCEWTCPPDLWLDMQAFADVSGLSIDELVNQALAAYVAREPPPDPRRV